MSLFNIDTPGFPPSKLSFVTFWELVKFTDDKFVFELVGIDIDGEIPIDLLREKMDEKNEQKEYLEFFLCADNFAWKFKKYIIIFFCKIFVIFYYLF